MNLKKLNRIAAALSAAFVFLTAVPAISAASAAGGGADAVTGKTDGTGYAAKLYNADNGLPTSDANDILATSDGFIWVGGYAGLMKYDGTSFERIDSTTGITNAKTLFEDSKGRLWVGTNDNGIVVLDRGFSKHFTYLDGLSSSSIRTITEDAAGNIIVGTTQGICYIDSSLTLHPLEEPQTDNAYILRLCSDSEGTVYGNTRSGSFFRIKDLRITDYYNGDDLSVGTVTTIAADPDRPGSVYLGTDKGLFCHGSFDEKFGDLVTSFPRYLDTVIQTDEFGNVTESYTAFSDLSLSINRIGVVNGTVWIVSDEKILYEDSGGVFHALSNIPLTVAIENFTVDFEGNLWFASSRQGIMKVVEDKFEDLSRKAGLKEAVVNSTCLHNGLLYIGTDSGMQVTDRNGGHTDSRLAEYLGDARIRCISEDNDGNMWVCTYTGDFGLVCLTADDQIVQYTEDEGLANNKCRCAVTAPDGTVLAATNGGLSIVRGGKIERSITAESGLSNTVVLTAEAGADGKYYMGTDGDGIYVSDGSNLSHIGRADGLTSDIILRLKRDDERGLMWIITSNSVQYMKDGVITNIEYMPYSNNYDVYFDSDGNAWFLASNGMYVANAADMLSGEKFDYMYYGVHDGLPSVPNSNSFSMLDTNGDLYIACRSNVTLVNIDSYFNSTHDIMFSVPYIEADDAFYYPDADNTFRLPDNADNITIHGYALTYSLHDPQIEYRLSGADSKWVILYKSDMQPVRYTNLRGGEYEFSLSLVNSSKHAVEQSMTVKIIKARAFYEQIWFYALCGVLAVLIIAAVIRAYIRHKTNVFLEKEREQKIFIRDMAEAFAKTIDVKDKYTNGHSNRVAKYTAMLTRELGYDENTVEKYYNIALLHDIGKIGVPMEVLNKPGKLTDEEFRIIKSHTTLGYNVLKDISIMPEIAVGAGSHHERPDGKGYPQGLKGDQIPRVAQIIAVADTFDAMYSTRPYRKRMNFEKVVSIIKEVSGTQLTPDVVEAFLRLVDKGEFRDPEDHGGGSTEDIVNIRQHFKEQEQEQEKSDVKIYTPHETKQ